MDNKLVSIAMCTYNGEKFLSYQLDSILNQTYKNLEIIITDDCSRDNTVKIIKEYMQKDNRIKFFQNKQNIGFIKNFEKAISLCNGNYIALADQDDIWKEKKIEIFITTIDKHSLIYSDAIPIDYHNNKIHDSYIRPHNNLVYGKCNKAFLHTNCVSGNTLMFKKELIQYILPIPTMISYHDIWIAFVASTYSSITFIAEEMIYYRRYEEQITHQKEIISNGFFNRTKILENRLLEHTKTKADDLKAFLELDTLQDDNTKKILQLLINHYTNYKNIFFNIKLYKTLKKFNNEIFAIRNSKNRKKELLSTVIGLKFHKITFFIFYDKEQNLLRKIRKKTKKIRATINIFKQKRKIL
jgi:glycosyltransferase involved in cell wall biosynthesis